MPPPVRAVPRRSPADNPAVSFTSGGVATGVILDYAGSTAPTGFLICDGASYSTTTYAALFAVIGYSFGGSGANFNVPDFRGRYAAGVGVPTQTDQAGNSLRTVTLAEYWGYRKTGQSTTTVQSGAGVSDVVTYDGAPQTLDNNMPPYVGVNKIIKV